MTGFVLFSFSRQEEEQVCTMLCCGGKLSSGVNYVNLEARLWMCVKCVPRSIL